MTPTVPLGMTFARVPYFAAAVLVALVASGCSKGRQETNTSATTTTASSPAPVAAAPEAAPAGAGGPADVAHGKTIFAQNCATCHGPSGTEGGVGPSLKNEKSRKNLDAAIAWIKKPQPPMPKLYPDPLSERDVRDVATFVESL